MAPQDISSPVACLMMSLTTKCFPTDSHVGLDLLILLGSTYPCVKHSLWEGQGGILLFLHSPSLLLSFGMEYR